jgi:hypothetical protein
MSNNECNICNLKCSSKSQYEAHIKTKKHNKALNNMKNEEELKNKLEINIHSNNSKVNSEVNSDVNSESNHSEPNEFIKNMDSEEHRQLMENDMLEDLELKIPAEEKVKILEKALVEERMYRIRLQGIVEMIIEQQREKFKLTDADKQHIHDAFVTHEVIAQTQKFLDRYQELLSKSYQHINMLEMKYLDCKIKHDQDEEEDEDVEKNKENSEEIKVVKKVKEKKVKNKKLK